MEVTKKNFKEVLAKLPEIFQKAQFVALDTEFTGLKVEGAPKVTCYDTLDDLYLSDRQKVHAFIAIQFGIVAFLYDTETDKYTHHAYNFYTYPSLKSNTTFRCESKTIKFLINHGFDFNKLFQDGIPYIRESDGQSLLEKLAQKHERNSHLYDVSKAEMSPQQQTILNNVKKKINEILESGSKQSFTVEKHNSYIRRLIYNTVKNEFGEKVFLETNKDESMTISVSFNSDEFKNKEENKFLVEKQEILDEIGFSNVIKLIIESKKLLVGHNILLDLLFTIHQCLTPLPDSYDEFKSLVQFLFPKVVDTKYMALSLELKDIKDTTLLTISEYFKNLKLIVDVDVDENGQGYTLNVNKLHEAGYDAYLTGVSFLAMTKYLGNLNACPDILKVLPNSPFLQPILNKIPIFRLLDVLHMNLGGVDIEPDRVGVYHVTFPKEWKRENIVNLFKNYGFLQLVWINDTSAYVKIKKEFINSVESNLMNENPVYSLCTYQNFQNSKRKANSNQNENHSNSLSAEKKNNSSTDGKNPSNNGAAFKLLSDVQKKRQTEDVGEAIERPSKKHFSLQS